MAGLLERKECWSAHAASGAVGDLSDLCDSYKLSRTELPTAACDDAVSYLSCRQGFAAGALKFICGCDIYPSAGGLLESDFRSHRLKNSILS